MSVKCQTCGDHANMFPILNLGYMPPPNEMRPVGDDAKPQEWLPTELWFCRKCDLAQLGYVPDQLVSFPHDYPYTSGMTPALRDDFLELADRCDEYLDLNDLVVDIGSNDGTLLSCFPLLYRRVGVEPTDVADIANKRGIRTEKAFFGSLIADEIVKEHGKARLVTCTNCFAHIPYIHSVIESVKDLLLDNGVFVTESHYLIDLINRNQYDTIYAEHLRYYTVASLCELFAAHGMRVFKVERIPTHGGSIRVYAEKGTPFVSAVPLIEEPTGAELFIKLREFAKQAQNGKTALLAHLHYIKMNGGSIVGIGAPSRASTVISYCGLDGLIDYILEQPGSLKIGKCMPGTNIPVVMETNWSLHGKQPEAAILFSWHLADKLIPKIRARGYKGQIILPCSASVIYGDYDAEIAVA